MRIIMTVDPEVPVPPVHYGGIERIVDILVRGLEARGHRVTLLAHPQSATAGRLVPWPGSASRSRLDTLRNAATLARTVLSEPADLVHSFSRLAYLTPLLPWSLPKLMSYHRQISERSVRLGQAASRGTLWFSAISRRMIEGLEELATWRLIYNGVPLSSYDFRPEVVPDAPLVFLGRVEEIKGPHLAVEVARRTGSRLVIAGNVPQEHRGWFDATIAPHLDGDRISYVGPVDDAQKNALLGRARALLMPILWEEPFGLVMAEAMACGTPVIALRHGATPEVVEDGVTGFVADDVDGMAAAVGRLDEIRRLSCRERVEHRFSDRVLVDRHMAVYEEMLSVLPRRRRPA